MRGEEAGGFDPMQSGMMEFGVAGGEAELHCPYGVWSRRGVWG